MARHYLGSKLSGEELSLGEVWEWYEFQAALIGEERVRTLDALLTGAALNQPRYFGLARDELVEFFDSQSVELKHAAMLTLIAATEAALRVDYIERVKNKKKDEISKAFDTIFKEYDVKASLENQILEVWKQFSTASTKNAIGEFKAALRLRHWLAHGRYWKPKLGREFDLRDVLEICNDLIESTVNAS